MSNTATVGPHVPWRTTHNAHQYLAVPHPVTAPRERVHSAALHYQIGSGALTSVTYDSDGQRTAMSDGTGSSSWSYDQLHRLTSYTNGNGDMVTYGYGSDLKDQVRSIVYPNSVGTVTQSWNDDGTLASVEDWNSKTTSFSYDYNANLTGITVPSTTNVTDTFGFNAANQMTSVSDSNGSTLLSANYTRDSNGQLASDDSVSSSVGSYKYTALNQLCYGGSSSSNACGSPPSGSNAYAFDNADNLTTNNGNSQQFNNADELCWGLPSGTSGNACGSVPTGATTYGYDNKGNRTSTVPTTGSATCDTYDQANRLTELQTGTGSTCTSPTTVGTYAYDGDGLRESKTVSGTTTQFTWDGMGGSLLQQYDGTTKTSFLYGPGGSPFEQIAGSTTTYLHHDQTGSTRLITDAAGATATATTITYDPYGNVASASGSLTTPLMFQGQYNDAESDLYYLRARYYDPTTAQFLTRDPMVARTMSPYAYVAGDPLDRSDPTGALGIFDMTGDEAQQLMTACGADDAGIGLCLAAVFCDSQIACETTQNGLAVQSAAMTEQADAMKCGSARDALEKQASQVKRYSELAAISAAYYQGGDFWQHASAAIGDAGTGTPIGGTIGIVGGCVATLSFFCAAGAAVGGTLGLIGGFVGGFLYGAATGNSVDAGEVWGIILDGLQAASG